MDLEIVTIGTELLLGFTLDTNAAKIAQTMAGMGVRVVRHSTVADRAEDIHDVVQQGLQRAGLVIVTGGLGPTRDDVTKSAVARIFDAPLVLDEDYLRNLEERFAAFRRGPMPVSNRSQAEVPRGARILPNPRGSAPGLWLEGKPGIAILLPGVPHEMEGLLREEVVPRLEQRFGVGGSRRVTRSRTLRTTGISESALADLLGDHEASLSSVSLAYLPQGIGADLRLTVWDVPSDEAERLLQDARDRLLPLLGPYFYGEEGVDLAAVVLTALQASGLKLSIAESCTGGLLGARVTAIAGASAAFAGGVVCYSDASKIRELGVAPAVIARHGAVSEEVVVAMVRGVAQRFETETAIAITGIAGPGGGSSGKPVGTVWLAARAPGSERAVRVVFPGGRSWIRERSAQAGLDLLRRMLLVEADAGRQT